MIFFFFLLAFRVEDTDEGQLYKSINSYRRNKNLPALRRSVQLDRAASVRVTWARNNMMDPRKSKELDDDFESRVKNAGYRNPEKLGEDLSLVKDGGNVNFYTVLTNIRKQNPVFDPILADYIDIGIASMMSNNKSDKYWDVIFGKRKGDIPVPSNLTIEGTL